jgi:short-subunit dehydrogenase
VRGFSIRGQGEVLGKLQQGAGMMGEQHKLAVVTGASAGLGSEFARQLASKGMDLLITARRVDRLESLATRLHAEYGVRVEVFPADLANPAELRALEDTLGKLERVDLLVNNAGYGLVGNFWELDRDAQTDNIHVHVVASMRLTHAVLPGMVARRSGGVIQVSSVAAFIPGKQSAMYSATKSFLVLFNQSLQGELRGSGVHCQALCPGFTLTEFHDVPSVGEFDRRSIPAWLWLKSGYVVKTSLREIERGSGVVVPGLGYRLAVFLLQTALVGGIVKKIITG